MNDHQLGDIGFLFSLLCLGGLVFLAAVMGGWCGLGRGGDFGDNVRHLTCEVAICPSPTLELSDHERICAIAICRATATPEVTR